MAKPSRINKFVGDQLSRWPLACDNFRALKNVEFREACVGGLKVKLQFNPARIVSSAAKLDDESIAERKCFLCLDNRPKEQFFLRFDGRKGKKYHILVNPYPIFPDHLVIAMAKHIPQSIAGRFVDMLDLSRKYSSNIIFYNGPYSGASAPDHHHFQAAPTGLLPLENDVNKELDNLENSKSLEYLTSVREAQLFHYKKFTRGVFVLKAETAKSIAKLLYRLLDCSDTLEGETEPRFNLFTWYKDGEHRAIVVFRTVHRSHHYFSDGDDHLTMSPGCADMGGYFIVPVEKEFRTITDELLSEMVKEVSLDETAEDKIIERLTRTQAKIEVGIMSAKEIEFELYTDGAGLRKAIYHEGKIEYGGAIYDELYFEEQTLSTQFARSTFALHHVTIGIGFHWERQEVQKFAGALKIIVTNGQLTAVNVVGVEDYLLSVISSEMKATSSLEFLKAHAVISRSWVMAQIKSSLAKMLKIFPDEIIDMPSLVTYLELSSPEETSKQIEYVKWYDHEDHSDFDVCADDHCQRYQGLTRALGENVKLAIDSTWGQVLKYGEELCDTRFSKCCGGHMEKFSTCWSEVDYPYLRPLPDTPNHDEDEIPFCNTSDPEILSQVLNNYDRETTDFYEWEQIYDKTYLSELIEKKTGYKLGELLTFEVLSRGESGRIYKLKIIGKEKTLIVGKELEIRRILSETHLKSSAFDVNIEDDKVIFKGHGWGHGVGLCQIGAAVMASKGYTYEEILQHYYPGSELAVFGEL